MKRIVRFSTIVTVAFIGVTLACSRQNPSYIGPAYIAAPDGFSTSALKPNKTSVNFPVPVNYNATFTSTVSWILTITGQTSGAVHVIEGTSANLSNVAWSGGMDGVEFFQTGEVAVATLSFYGTSLTTSASVTITGAANYAYCGYFAPSAGFNTPSGNIPNNGWNFFNKSPNPKLPGGSPFNTFLTTIVNVKQGVAVSGGTGDNALQSDRNGNLVVAPEGAGYYYIKGLGDQSAYVSGVGFGTYMPQAIGMYTSLASYSPSDIWVNVYLYGSGDANAKAQLEFQESAGPLIAPNPVNDNYWEAYVTLNHKGWKLFSFKYSDLTVSTIKLNGGNGDGIQNPGKLWGFDVTLQKVSNPNSPVELFMDYPIITIGGPFKPCY